MESRRITRHSAAAISVVAPEAQAQESTLEIDPPALQEEEPLAAATVAQLGDDTSKLLVGMPGEVLVFSLPSGELSHNLTSPADRSEPFFGHEVSVIDDLPDDGPAGPDYYAFGSSVAQVPDLDGDGVDDLAIGAPHLETPTYADGKVHIFGGATGTHVSTLEQQEDISADDSDLETHRSFGKGIAPAGDVNGDETTDLMVAGDDGAILIMDGVSGEQLAGFEADFSSHLEVHTPIKETGPRPLVSASLSALSSGDSGRLHLVIGGDGVRLYDSADFDIAKRSPEEADQIREMNRANSEELASWIPDSLDAEQDDLREREFEGHELYEGRIEHEGQDAVAVVLLTESLEQTAETLNQLLKT